MADLVKYNKKYFKEAITEPVNFWGLAGFAVAAAYTQSIVPLVFALILELIYLAFTPNIKAYRQIVDQRETEKNTKLREKRRQELISGFHQREQEAVYYLRDLKNKIYENYLTITPTRELPSNLKTLDQRWADFVDLLDIYRRRKGHLKQTDRKVVHNQLSQAFRAMEAAPDERTKRIQQANIEILKRRINAFEELENSVKLVEGQLQSIENFFKLVNDQIVSLPTPERVSQLDFEQLSDSIALTKQMLEATNDAVGALDSHNREVGNYELLSPNRT